MSDGPAALGRTTALPSEARAVPTNTVSLSVPVGDLGRPEGVGLSYERHLGTTPLGHFYAGLAGFAHEGPLAYEPAQDPAYATRFALPLIGPIPHPEAPPPINSARAKTFGGQLLARLQSAALVDVVSVGIVGCVGAKRATLSAPGVTSDWRRGKPLAGLSSPHELRFLRNPLDERVTNLSYGFEPRLTVHGPKNLALSVAVNFDWDYRLSHTGGVTEERLRRGVDPDSGDLVLAGPPEVTTRSISRAAYNTTSVRAVLSFGF